MSQEIAFEFLKIDKDIQCREQIDMNTVESYAEQISEDAVFPPITVFKEGNEYWVADGFHRVEACKRLRRDSIPAEVHDGGKREAILYSVGANSTHGLRRTNKDKRRAVAMLLRDDEWSTWPDREIAKRCGVSHTFVSTVRQEQSPSGNGCQIDKPETRTVHRGGSTYQQKPKVARPKAARPTPAHQPASPTRATEPDPDDAPMYLAYLAMARLQEIDRTDPDRVKALRWVRDWIDRQLEELGETTATDEEQIPLASRASRERTSSSH